MQTLGNQPSGAMQCFLAGETLLSAEPWASLLPVANPITSPRPVTIQLSGLSLSLYCCILVWDLIPNIMITAIADLQINFKNA